MESVWIFGATGDLTIKKLLPALEILFNDGRDFYVVGVGRRDFSHEGYRSFVREKVFSGQQSAEPLLSRLFYGAAEFDPVSGFEWLTHLKKTLDAQYGVSQRTLFFLATMPEFFPKLAGAIRQSGLTQGPASALILEKPFGYNLETAKTYNLGIRDYFEEKEILRTDHYLGKAMIRNVLSLRFSNAIFDAVWCKERIAEIRVTASETIGIEGRGNYYEQSGALRDMVQNHLLQMVALVAMEPPAKLTPENIRSAKIQVMKHISLDENKVVVGQYTGNDHFKSYIEESGNTGISNTETFATLTLYVNSERWRGVPFRLMTGKRLSQKNTSIEIIMKSTLLADQFGISAVPNRIEIKVQPDEGVRIEFNVLQPDSGGNLIMRELDYCQSCLIDVKSPGAYEKLLLDALNGDATLFTSWEEIEQAWKLIDPLVKRVRDGDVQLQMYEAGSGGPL